MEYKEALTYLLFLTQGLLVFIFRRIEKDINDDIKKIELDTALLKEQHKNQLLVNLTLENNINNYKQDIYRLTSDINEIKDTQKKFLDDFHKLVNIVNNKTMEKQYAEQMMSKIDKIMNKIDEKN